MLDIDSSFLREIIASVLDIAAILRQCWIFNVEGFKLLIRLFTLTTQDRLYLCLEPVDLLGLQSKIPRGVLCHD